MAADACTPVTKDANGNQTSIGNAQQGDCAEKTSFSFGSCGTSNVGITCLVTTILNFLSVAVGIAVVVGITVGGITYSTAGGNPAKVKKGGAIIGSALGGLVLFFLMYAIINFLLPKGTLN